MRLFKDANHDVVDTYDVTHKLACLVKAELEADPRWAEFLRFCTSSLFQLQQSRGAFLTPPAPRSLERYMNVDRHTEWACPDAGNCWTCQRKPWWLNCWPWTRRKPVPSWRRNLGGCVNFRQEVARYQCLLEVVKQTEQEVKNHGLGRRTAARALATVACGSAPRCQSGRLLEELRGYLKEEGSKVPVGQSWLGSSDVIESLFGKYKCFAEKAPDAEVGASVLALPLFTVRSDGGTGS